jgi:hypothetical protein
MEDLNRRVTRQRYDDHSTPFGLWLRRQRVLDSRTIGLDAENLDYIFFYFKNGYLMLLGEKRFGGHQTAAQKDTHNLINQMLAYAGESSQRFNTMRGLRPIKYAGYHVIVFSDSDPDDSQWIRWDGGLVTKEELTQKLRTCNGLLNL